MGNVIIIRSVYGKVNQTYFMQPCPDPKTGKLPTCVKTVDSNGDMLLSENDIAEMSAGTKHFIAANEVFAITDGTVFDLDDVVDNAKWEAIKHCNWIAKDRYERDSNGNLIIDGNAIRYGVADLYVERPGEIAKAKISKKQLIHKACDYVYNDSESNRIKKCRVLGRNLNNAIPADVLDFLIDKAEKDPKKIIDLYEGEDWRIQLFIVDAIERGVIRKSEGIYKYTDKVLGVSMESVVLFMKDIKNKQIRNSISLETYPELATKAEQEEENNNFMNTIASVTGSEEPKKITNSTKK